MYQTVKVALCVMALSLFFSQACPAETPGSWDQVADSIRNRQNETRAAVKNVQQSISAQRRRLKRQLAALQKDVARSRKSAGMLEKRLESLKSQEAILKRQLSGKQDRLRKIEVTVRDNATLFLDNDSFSSLPPVVRKKLTGMAQSDRFPSQEDIRLLTGSLLAAIADSGRIHVGQEPVFSAGGEEKTATVLHVGGFQALYRMGDEAGFLVRDPTSGTLQVAPYRAGGRERAAILAAIQGGDHLPIDISTGSFLLTPPQKRDFWQGILKGGYFIWPLLAIAVIGAILVVERAIVLYRLPINGREAVGKADGLSADNLKTPAERVVHAVFKKRNGSAEAMENGLEEAVLQQLPPLERFLQTIKVLATVSPLLGLLGTVSGIIRTFQVITAHGQGDPKLLSAGISEALLTTEVGLLVAIPLLLCHHFLHRRVQTMVLDMEYAGMTLITARVQKGRD